MSEKNESQKGRVSFGHAYAITEVKIDEEYSYLLGSQNPSYYPLYLGNGQTWNSEDVRIAGRKRYPVREHIMKSMSGTDDMMSHFIPLKAGAVFGCKVRFHNLKPLELSSLLASLLFNGISGCYHSLGMGKPYGFGKTKINIKSIDINNIKEDDIDKLLSVYQLEFKERIDNSKALKELYAMASGIPQNRGNDLCYMQMSLEKDKHEFVD